MQGAGVLRSETYIWYVVTTKDELERHRWACYFAVRMMIPGLV
jgi:hypothetical protein